MKQLSKSAKVSRIEARLVKQSFNSFFFSRYCILFGNQNFWTKITFFFYFAYSKCFFVVVLRWMKENKQLHWLKLTKSTFVYFNCVMIRIRRREKRKNMMKWKKEEELLLLKRWWKKNLNLYNMFFVLILNVISHIWIFLLFFTSFFDNDNNKKV